MVSVNRTRTLRYMVSPYTVRKAAGIYRYRRSLLKLPAERVGKGYLYRNLKCKKK